MTRPEGGDQEGTPSAPHDVVRPGTGVVRPGTGVVRPGSGQGAAGNAGVVRPPSSDSGTAKASAAVPEAEKPLDPIHVVLPVIPVMPAKQGFLDRLVAGKSEAEKAAEEAQREEEARAKAEEAQRKADEKVRQKEDEARAKAEEKARKEAEEAEEKARAKAEERARRLEERRRTEEKARRALERQREEEEEEDEEEPPPIRQAPSRPAPMGPPAAPPRPAPRPGPGGPGPGPAPARPLGPPPGRGPRVDQRYARDDWYEEPRRRSPKRWLVAVAAAVGLGAGSAAVTTVVTPPPVVAFQPGIDTGSDAPVLHALDRDAPLPTHAGLEAALGPLLANSGLGGNPSMTVADAATGQVLWDQRGGAGVTPASATKVLTAVAALSTRGPSYRIPTRAVRGAQAGEVVLVGGGDPTLTLDGAATYRGAARLDDLAAQVRTALGGSAPTKIIVDSSLFQGSSVGPSGQENVGSQVANITALMTNGGHTNPSYRGDHPSYYQQPDIAAGRLFAQALGLPQSAVTKGTAPAGAQVLGEVLSPPLGTIVEQMLTESDNTLAEMMGRQIALAKGYPATFADAARATREVLAQIGVPMPAHTGLHDNSGLSHDNTVTTELLVSLLVMAASPDHPELRWLISGLAVAGYSGTLDVAHQRSGAGKGVTRAKTGTLNGVNALAGYVTDKDGRLLAFAMVANGTPSKSAAESALDKLAFGISGCGCR